MLSCVERDWRRLCCIVSLSVHCCFRAVLLLSFYSCLSLPLITHHRMLRERDRQSTKQKMKAQHRRRRRLCRGQWVFCHTQHNTHTPHLHTRERKCGRSNETAEIEQTNQRHTQRQKETHQLKKGNEKLTASTTDTPQTQREERNATATHTQ